MNPERWNRPKQTIFTTETTDGDCWRCCIAAILNVPAESVPHFGADPHCDAETQKWLNARGYVMIQVEGGGFYPPIRFPQWGKPVQDKTPNTAVYPIIACGPTIRTKKPGDHHAVVWLDRRVVYDPHPS
jgi:hypothetical protein